MRTLKKQIFEKTYFQISFAIFSSKTKESSFESGTHQTARDLSFSKLVLLFCLATYSRHGDLLLHYHIVLDYHIIPSHCNHRTSTVLYRYKYLIRKYSNLLSNFNSSLKRVFFQLTVSVLLDVEALHVKL